MIYFARLESGAIKIGTSEDVETRIRVLGFHYGTCVELLATLPGGRDKERELHEQFAHLRLERTEQFRPAPDLMVFIGVPVLVDINPDLIEITPAVPCTTGRRAVNVQLYESDDAKIDLIKADLDRDGRSKPAGLSDAVRDAIHRHPAVSKPEIRTAKDK